MDYLDFESTIGYRFSNTALLKTALTHSSYVLCDGHKTDYNERLEFLGDAILEFVVSDYIYRKNQNEKEGALSKKRARMVCEPALAKVANHLDINHFLIIGHGEELSGGREKDSILSDAIEALIGAIYLDGGIIKTKDFILKKIIPFLEQHDIDTRDLDYKSRLKELIDKRPGSNLEYVLIFESGPDHDKLFSYNIVLNDIIIGNGVGKTKQQACQNAAKLALETIQNDLTE